MHARAVKGYPLRNKTDRNDTDAILEASRSEKVKPIPVKSALRQQIQQVHMMREGWKKTRTMRINQVRGILREFGIEAPVKSKRTANTVWTIRCVGVRVSGLRSQCRIQWDRTHHHTRQACRHAPRAWGL